MFIGFVDAFLSTDLLLLYMIGLGFYCRSFKCSNYVFILGGLGDFLFLIEGFEIDTSVCYLKEFLML